ncbi:hypothetical protein A7A08_01007 [Methyloligella halotolerans]|uniref:Uncharacterized protein n=1 Tax=Methyloligella halotolerans TaxID=1177755 RepID=A0A1E2S043_9HYPH|nr:hypothetical protein [Methyloligella halotolerans]ODA67841.1 hypothetical protein A7A08_01007 [Methyloligella halotolerans]
MHRLSRALGVILLLFAMVALVVDGTKSLGAGGDIVITPLAQQWQDLAPESYAGSQSWVNETAGPGFWELAALPILGLPAWAIFGVLGIFLYWLGQKREKTEVFIN